MDVAGADVSSIAMALVHTMRNFLKIFLICQAACTVLAMIGWELLVNGMLYHCSDGGAFDYLSTGDWVHGQCIEVPRIHQAQSMSEPDQILEGWSQSRLELLRGGSVLFSALISAGIASL